MTERPVLEDRLLLYADILGWKAATDESHDGAILLEAIRELHAPADAHNERTRADLESARRDGTVVWINPIYQQVQFGAFSDNLVYSMPPSFGGRILSAASDLILSLLHRGFLTRGAIVLGKLHHVDNVVFGPALNEAVDIERHQANYPRILVTDAAAECIERRGYDPAVQTMIQDHEGQRVANPFVIPFAGPHGLIPTLPDNLRPAEIDARIAENIAALAATGDARDARNAAKWRYMESLIRGPVFAGSPRLRRAWERGRVSD